MLCCIHSYHGGQAFSPQAGSWTHLEFPRRWKRGKNGSKDTGELKARTKGNHIIKQHSRPCIRPRISIMVTCYSFSMQGKPDWVNRISPLRCTWKPTGFSLLSAVSSMAPHPQVEEADISCQNCNPSPPPNICPAMSCKNCSGGMKLQKFPCTERHKWLDRLAPRALPGQ